MQSMTNKQQLVMSIVACALVFSPMANAQNKTAIKLLPKPHALTFGKGVFATSGAIKVENTVGEMAENVFLPSWAADAKGQTDRVVRYAKLVGASSPEAYRLHVVADTLQIEAAAKEGFMRAWQTVGQITDKKGVPCVDVEDAPAYKWRGLMLDVVRHFYPLSFIKRQIDVMAQYKFNRLHLHLTDAEGWRMEIKRYPRLTDSVAYRPIENWADWREAGQP